MKYFLIAGEASGDLHGANLMKGLKKADTSAEFRFFGGPLMEKEGGKLLKHYREMAFMGVFDVLKNLKTIRKNFRFCQEQLLAFRPDVLILIDYPGFNLKMAEFAHRHGIRVFYYIAPKLWAWKAWRIKKVKAFVDEMFTIFPFETEFFARYQYPVHYVGNPLLDAIGEARKSFRRREDFLRDNRLGDKPVVALLPGSRRQEIRLMLPVMSRLAAQYPDFQFVISGAPAVDPQLYQTFSADPALPVLNGQTYELLHHAFAAVVTSGTATLETALLQVPQVVLYHMTSGKIPYRIFRRFFLKVNFVSLPNLVLGRGAVREFIVDEMKFELVNPEVNRLLHDENYRNQILEAYREIGGRMGEAGASQQAAGQMTRLLRGESL